MNNLKVIYHNRFVGTLALKNDTVYFQYSDEWLKSGFTISPLSLPLTNKLFKSKNNIFDGLFGVFADSLPDAWGRLILNRYLNKHKELENINIIDYLSLIGNSGMGALEYLPMYEKDDDKTSFNLSKFQLEADELLNKNKCNDIEFLLHYSGSSGGARPKALINLEGESYIVKFQSHYDIPNAGQMEYDYAMACKKCGINMPQFKLLTEGNHNFFAIKRFDRENNNKIHMLSVAALLEADYRSPCLDYEQLFSLTNLLTNNSEEQLYELFRRMCFNVHAHNLDDHLKNFTFIYNEDLRKYELSPAYDMTFSNTYYGEHTTSINGKGKDITDNDLYLIGKKAKLNINKLKDINEKIKSIVKNDLSKYLI